MKYMRKTPVEAIQWNGDNLNEVYDFIIKTAKSCCAKDDYSDLIIAYEDRRGRKFKTVIPLFGWVVREGKTFQFYKDATFRKTFEEVPDDEHEEITDSIIKDVNQILEDVRASIENGQMFAKYYNLINPYGRLTKLIDDLYKADEKTREEIKKNMDECLKEMAGSDTHNATFESVLDEMKELHAKKDKDYVECKFNKNNELNIKISLRIKKGIDINIKDNNGLTALDLVRDKKKYENIQKVIFDYTDKNCLGLNHHINDDLNKYFKFILFIFLSLFILSSIYFLFIPF